MSRKLIFSFILMFSAFVQSVVADGSDYQKGWNAFLSNNRADARKYFGNAVNYPSTKADALLSLSFVDWMEDHLDDAFNNFCAYYASEKQPYASLYAVSGLPFVFEQGNLLSPKKVAFFEKTVGDPNMNGTLKAVIYQRLGEQYNRLNNPKKATEYYDRVGSINSWQVLGTFDNTSGSGFDKDWGAVKKAKTTDVFKNKVDANVYWYTPPYNKANHWFYFDYYFSLNNSIEYAQSFVTSPVNQDVYLRVGTSGSLKVWINDALVASVPEERNCDLDIYSYYVKLNKGVNRVLVQIGQSEIDNANFLLRFTDANANSITGLTSSAVYATYTPSSTQTANSLLPFFAEEILQKKVGEQPENPLYSILLAEVYLRNDKAYEATRVLRKLQTAYPASTLVSYRLSEAYSRSKNQTDYDKEMENIRLKDPDSFFGLQEQYNEDTKSEKYSDAAEVLAKTIELYGNNEQTDSWSIAVASNLKQYDKVVKMAIDLYKKYPDNENYMNLNYLIEKNISKNPTAALNVVNDYCKKYFDTDALETLSDIYFEAGLSSKGLDVLRKRIDRMPYAFGYLDNLSSQLFKMQRYKDALDVTDKMLQLSPYTPGIYNTRGYIFKSMNEKEKAIESFEKSIYYGPTSYDSRTQLRLLQNKKEMSDLFPKTNLDSLIQKAPNAAKYPQDNSLLLLNDYKVIIYQEAAKEFNYEIAVKILNQSGIDSWKQYNISYNDNNQKLIIDKAEVIKANGSKVKAETNNNQVVFTNLEVGDVLHLTYRVQDFSTGKLAKHFFDHFLLQYSIPSLINRYSILIPSNKTFKYLVTHGKVDPKISNIEDMKLYWWELDNQAAVKSEPYMSALQDVVPTLYCSSIPDWQFVSDWYKDLTYSKFNSDYVLNETVSNLMKGHENSTALEKAKIIYRYILENISYSDVSFMHSNFIPQKASRTITTRLGDCKDVSTLFVAMCREAGITTSNLVLISTRNYGNNTMPLPAVDFNHCIAQLDLDGKTYYLELTNNVLPFGAGMIVDLNSQILPIPGNNTNPAGDKLLRMEMPFRTKNGVYRYHNIQLSGNDMIISRKSIAVASFAAELRNTYKNVGSDDQLKNLTQAVANDFNTPIKIHDLKFTNLNNLNDSLFIEYKMDVRNALQDVAGMKIFMLPWTQKISSPDAVAAESRTYPMEIWSFLPEEFSSEEIVLNLPQGKKMIELPADIKYECANASYQLTFDTKNPSKIIIHRYFQRKTEQVIPSQYADFRNFLNKVSESDNKQYAIK